MASVQTPKLPAQTVGAVGAVGAAVAPAIVPEQSSPDKDYNSNRDYDSSKVLKDGYMNNPVY